MLHVSSVRSSPLNWWTRARDTKYRPADSAVLLLADLRLVITAETGLHSVLWKLHMHKRRPQSRRLASDLTFHPLGWKWNYLTIHLLDVSQILSNVLQSPGDQSPSTDPLGCDFDHLQCKILVFVSQIPLWITWYTYSVVLYVKDGCNFMVQSDFKHKIKVAYLELLRHLLWERMALKCWLCPIRDGREGHCSVIHRSAVCGLHSSVRQL